MRPSLSFFPIFLFSLFVTASASAFTGKEQGKDSRLTTIKLSQVTPEWTIMVFINGDNNLEESAIQDFMEMAKVGSSDQVNIIAQVDLIGKYINAGWTQTLRFRITKGMEPTIQNALEDLGEVNMGEGTALRDFVSWSIANYPANKYALIIWDHGQGYRLMSPSLVTKETITKTLQEQNKARTSRVQNSIHEERPIRILSGDPFRSPTGSPYKSCSNDETNQDELYNREIQENLKAALNGNKLDLIGFDACLMAMIETAFAMRNVSLVLVGSEDLEPGSGWQYDDWLQKLQSNTSINGADFGKLLVESYSQRYGRTQGFLEEDPTTTLSAISLSNFDNIATTISNFANRLSFILNTEIAAIRQARSECKVFAPNAYNEYPPREIFFHIDFIRFCDQILANVKDAELKRTAQLAKEAVLPSIIHNYRGAQRDENNGYGGHGLAIYFPISGAQYKSDEFEKGGYKKGNTHHPVEFVERHKWSEFLQSYFVKVAR